jgi:ubiquinone biosynthesis monooxygenase Coq7
MSEREADMLDEAIVGFDKVLRTMFAPVRGAREMPASDVPEPPICDNERRRAAALMRVNHCGEICAQALYQGQALAASDRSVAEALSEAAGEEMDHLAWTGRRIAELGGRTSLLNPVWYAGSFGLGLVAGRLGPSWNLGFLAETEKQVEAHLTEHLDLLPEADTRSRALLEQMRSDEIGHGLTAIRLGARELPRPIKLAMTLASRIMIRTAYWI